MKTRVIFLCLALIFSGSQVFAQLSKAERKEWKTKAKEYKKNPASLMQLTDEKQTAESSVSTLTTQNTQLQSQISDKNAQIADLQDQLARLRADLNAARAELAALRANPPTNPMDFSQGVVFKVQIGAFTNKDLSKYFENNPNFGGETAAAETEPQKITIGIFRDYWEADTFKKYMREMGVKDAWIVPYRDGQRVEIKDVLEGVTAETPPAAASPDN